MYVYIKTYSYTYIRMYLLWRFRDILSLSSLSCYRERAVSVDPCLSTPLSSCPLDLRAILSWRNLPLTSLEREISMKPRAIPMHNFLLRYFPAYRVRIFSLMLLLVSRIFAHAIVCVYTYVRACPSAIERVEKRRGRNRMSEGKL